MHTSLFDISEIIEDPHWCQPFEIVRTTQIVNDYGRGVETEEVFQSRGVIYPAQGQDLERLEEADRVMTAFTIITRDQLLVSTETQKADKVIWNGMTLNIYSVDPWIDYGYTHAVAVLDQMGGIPQPAPVAPEEEGPEDDDGVY